MCRMKFNTNIIIYHQRKGISVAVGLKKTIIEIIYE